MTQGGRGVAPPPTSKYTPDSESGHGHRPDMVDTGSCHSQWQTFSDHSLGSDSGSRCLQDRMGCLLSGIDDRRTLDKERKTKSHQLSRAISGFLALKSFMSDKKGINILLRGDNVTAIAFLNRMGGPHSQELSDLAVEIWECV